MKILYVMFQTAGNTNGDGVYYLIDAENGEAHYAHYCSNISFAFDDLIFRHPERIAEMKRLYDEWKVVECTPEKRQEFIIKNQFLLYLKKVQRFYRDDKRFYHTIEHIRSMFFLFLDHEEEFEAEFPALKTEKCKKNLFWAIAYHDSFYVPGFQFNEELSNDIIAADLFADDSCDISELDKAVISTLIVSTKVGSTLRSDMYGPMIDVLHDLDWFGFSSYDLMIENEKKIKAEAVAISKCDAGGVTMEQRKFYKGLIGTQIFRTKAFSKFNETAQRNLMRRIGEMKQC